MKNNKKTLVLAIASILSAGALVGVAASTQLGGVANIFAADNEDSYIWNHYKAVAPTIDSHGSKEFWANCSVLGKISFEKPTKGKVQKENLDFTATPWFNELTPDDARYVAPLSSKTVATLSSENVTVIKDEGSSFMTFSGAMDELAWKAGATNYGEKAKIIEEFGGSSRENDGIFIKTIKSELGETLADVSVTLPAINFLEELKDGGVISMELGCRTGQGYIKFNGTKLFSNSTAAISYLTKAKAYFYLDNGSVKVSFIILEKDSADKTYSKYLRKEVTSSLSTEEANGTKGIVYNFGTNKYSRQYWLSNPTLVSKKEFKTPARTTRPADDLYESYSFAGWYSETGKYDFSKPITAEERFAPKWVPGKQAPSYLDIDWSKTAFNLGEGGKDMRMCSLAEALSVDTWGKSDAEKTTLTNDFNKNCSILGVNDETGVFFRTGSKAAYAEIPALDFNSLIPNGKKIYMRFGSRLNNNSLYVNCGTGTDSSPLTKNSNAEIGYQLLTKTLVSFYKGNDGKVHMACDDLNIDKFQADYESRTRIWDKVLSDGQASGTERLKLTTATNGSNRSYWIGKPFIYKDDEIVLDVTGNDNPLTVSNGELQTKTTANATGKAPYNQWYSNVSTESDGIGAFGNIKGKAMDLTFTPVNFATQFEKLNGVRFTIGVWNGSDSIYYKDGLKEASLGKAFEKPLAPGASFYDPMNYTREIIEKTWHNWQATVDRFDGLTVYNQNTAEKYQFALTEGQLNGTEPLSFKLTASNANEHFFYISNLTTFYC